MKVYVSPIPTIEKKSEIFFSTNVRAGEIVESLCSKTDDNVIIVCAKILSEECNSYKSDTDCRYYDANDVNISFNIIKKDRPKTLEKFLKF